MHGLGDLALFLGGDETSFTGDLLRLIAKAQSTPSNYEALRRGFPETVRVVVEPVAVKEASDG